MATEGSSFLDVNALKSVENIRRVIGQYREEQEQLMKKMSQDSSRGVSLAKDVSIDRICDYCSLISVGRKSSGQIGSWPQTLVGSLSNKSVGLGSFESNGSLWRFVKIDDAHGLRVVIECAEVGEKIQYLTSNLELSESNSYAAEWIVTQVPTEKGSGDLMVTLRLHEDERVLCSHEEAGLALLPPHEAKQPDDSSVSAYWCSDWVIVAEDLSPGAYGDELNFLDDELNMGGD